MNLSKMTLRIILGQVLLCCIFYNTVCAQKINPTEIGSKLPELQLKHIYGKPSEQLKLSDFRGKAILLDFWATWCPPCVASLPFLDSLQRRFRNDLMVICVTREGDKTVNGVLNRQFSNNPPAFLTVLKDSVIEKYFPHQSIPHCILIDKKGIVMAITEKVGVTYDSIHDLIDGNTLKIDNKPRTIKYDTHKPPYASKQVVLGDEFLYHSMVTKYREDLNPSYARGINNDFIACINSSIVRLFQCAYGKFDLSWLDMNRVVCRGFTDFTDSAKIGIFKSEALINNWKNNIKTNAYSYELAVRDTFFTTDGLFEMMQQDLNRYFSRYGIEVHPEKINRKVLALVYNESKNLYNFKQGSGESIKISGDRFLRIANQPIAYFLSQLQPYLKVKVPVVNRTGYTGKINIEINGDMSSVSTVNKSLGVYGLKLIEKEEPTEVIVITKNPNAKNLP
ncbi:redoxin family protein [Flavobacterium sp. Sd200]|uniref:redoxin family protein n=1 Tax=Flavobacterium sp. Sd200 TaxID=2692211 RepID=UPI00136E8CE9|nr:redoxin family protein [Flavobacterium sp. Sd200]MXN91143.1 redoxin family protein [Flavobacterium sp. Sd200]